MPEKFTHLHTHLIGDPDGLCRVLAGRIQQAYQPHQLPAAALVGGFGYTKGTQTSRCPLIDVVIAGLLRFLVVQHVTHNLHSIPKASQQRVKDAVSSKHN